MSEIDRAALERPSLRHPLRHRWPRGVLGFMAYFYDHCVRRYDYPVNWHDVMLLDDSLSAFMVCANGGICVFDGIEVDILRRLVRGDGDNAIAAGLGVRAYCVANVRAKLRRDLGVATAAQLRQLALDYGRALEC